MNKYEKGFNELSKNDLEKLNEMIDERLPEIWDQAEKNLKSLKEEWVKRHLLQAKDSVVLLDPNNPEHVEIMEDVDIDDSERGTVSQRLEKALKEMQQIRNGEIPKKTWRDIYLEMKEELD